MREIKFRAWDTDNKGNFKRWMYGTPMFGDMGQLYIHNHITQTLCQRTTLGQFTGLTDKNGKEIYEGDVVGFFDRATWPVIFADGAFRFGNDVTNWPAKELKKKEVIGNVYENPELLNV